MEALDDETLSVCSERALAVHLSGTVLPIPHSFQFAHINTDGDSGDTDVIDFLIII